MEYIFLFKENDTDDRDAVRYVRIDDIRNRAVGCDGKITVHGACYCMSLKDDVPYEDITTILTEEQYKRLCDPRRGDSFDDVIDALMSEENAALFERVQQEEKEYLYDEYSLDEDDVDAIFDEYRLDYRDRGVVGCVFDDAEEFGRDEAINLGCVQWNGDDVVSRYFDFQKFGEDLTEEEWAMELSDGRIVTLNY